MKKRYIFLSILVVFIIAAGVLLWINADNIKAIYKATQYNTEEIEKQIEESEKKNTEILQQYNKADIKPLSEEDSEKLTKGELSEEEAINLVLGRTQESENAEKTTQSPQEQPTEKQPEEQQPQMSVEDEDRLGELIAKVYVLKGKYNKLIADENYYAASDFYSLPKDQQTKEKKYERGVTFMRNVLKLQDECDGEMNKIFTEMTDILKRNNMTTELVDEIKKAYEQEKELKKAYYVNKYTE